MEGKRRLKKMLLHWEMEEEEDRVKRHIIFEVPFAVLQTWPMTQG